MIFYHCIITFSHKIIHSSQFCTFALLFRLPKRFLLQIKGRWSCLFWFMFLNSLLKDFFISLRRKQMRKLLPEPRPLKTWVVTVTACCKDNEARTALWPLCFVEQNLKIWKKDLKLCFMRPFSTLLYVLLVEL